MSRSLPAAAVVLLWHGSAAAQAPPLDGDDPTDPYALPDAPAPPSLPDLTHRALAASVDTTFASIHGNMLPDGTDPGRSFGWNERIEAEQAVSIRRWYVGVSEQLALGKPSGQNFLLVAANPEVWGRALWASQAGLAYGGGLGVVLPGVPHGAAGTEVAQTIRALRPWDYVHFVNNDFIFRPFIDVRDIDGRVILQLRQGIDWDRSSGALTSRTTFYVGYRLSALFGLGFEAWEVYLIQAPLRKDDGRAAYAVSPSVRFMTRVLQPAVSVLLPIDRPLFDAVDSFWAVRLSVNVVIEARPAPLSPAERSEVSAAGAASSRCEPLRAAAEHPKGWNTQRGGTPEGVEHPEGWDFPGSSPAGAASEHPEGWDFAASSQR